MIKAFGLVLVLLGVLVALSGFVGYSYNGKIIQTTLSFALGGAITGLGSIVYSGGVRKGEQK